MPHALLAALLAALLGCTQPSGEPDRRAEAVPAGDPGAPGPYPVGISTFVIPELEGQQDVSVEVWYPAAQAGDEPTTYDVLGLQVPAGGSRDVAVEPTAPQFLVGFSHGLGGVRQQNWTMAERLASHGFIVVSPDHPGTTTAEFVQGLGDLQEPLLRRPGTLIGAVDAVYDGAVDGLRPREDGHAIVGHSLGALTAMFVGGVELDFQAYQEICGGEAAPGYCNLIGPIEVTQEDLAALAEPDPRVVTTVLQSPAGQFALVPQSLANIPWPFVQAGELDDPAGTSEPTFALLADPARMAMYDDAGHNAPTNICDIGAAALFSPDCGGVEDGYADPDVVREHTVRHVTAWLGATLGGQPEFEAWLGPGEGWDWRE